MTKYVEKIQVGDVIYTDWGIGIVFCITNDYVIFVDECTKKEVAIEISGNIICKLNSSVIEYEFVKSI